MAKKKISTSKKRVYRKKSEPKLVSKPIPKPELKRTIIGYFATYAGNSRNVRLFGVGNVYPGNEFPVTKELYDALKKQEAFKVRIKYKDGD